MLRLSPRQVVLWLRGLVAACGGEMTAGNATRFAVVGLLGMGVDLGVFHALRAAGVGLAAGHITSFFAATVTNYILNSRWAFRSAGPPTSLGWRGYARFLAVCLLAMFFRGGVLAFGVQRLGWPAGLSLVVAIGAAAAVNYVGCVFYVFPGREPVAGVRWRIAAVGLFGYSLILRLVYLGLPNLFPQEAYYWNYAQHPALGYLDHPPMVSWLIAGGTAVFGDTELGVRLGAVFCSLAAAGFVYGLARRLFDVSAALCAGMLAGTLPYFFGTGFLATPEAPLVACWAGALFFLERALLGGRRLAWWGVGLCIGLGMLSKYTIALLGLATLVFVLLDRPSRRWLVRPEPYAAALLALLVFSPVVLWNAAHDWASFVFQTTRRLGTDFEFSLHLLVGAVVLLITPLGVLGGLAALGARARPPGDGAGGGGAARRGLFLGAMTLAPLAVFALYSVRQMPKMNWTGPLWLGLLPVLGRQIAALPGEVGGRLASLVRRAWGPMLAGLMLAYAAILHYLVLGLPGAPSHAELLGDVDWRELGRSVEQLEEEVEARIGDEPLVVGTDPYHLASSMAFYRRHSAEGVLYTASQHLIGGGKGLMYEVWFPPEQQAGKTFLLVSLKPEKLSGEALAGYFAQLEPVREEALSRNGQPAGKFYWRVAHGYRPPLGRSGATKERKGPKAGPHHPTTGERG